MALLEGGGEGTPPGTDQEGTGFKLYLVNDFEATASQDATPDTKQKQSEFHVPFHERCLLEVDNLNQSRRPDGSIPQEALDDILVNLFTAVQEDNMPYAITTTEHIYEETGEVDEKGRKVGVYKWMGRNAVENAMNGYKFHHHQSAHDRVAVEVDEARYKEENLKPGMTKIFISPRMSRADAPYDVAKQEHLANDDAVRTSTLVEDERNNTRKSKDQSMLFPDIPLYAWVDMHQDENNIFGKAINIKNPNSALSVMKEHKELEIPTDQLPEGPLTIVKSAITYIKEPELRKKLEMRAERFHTESQEDMQEKAMNIAKRWQPFEKELADSLYINRATSEIRSFINGLKEEWDKNELRVINNHLQPDSEYSMSRDLAIILEKAKRRSLWTRAAVITGNKKVLKQMDEETRYKIYESEMKIQASQNNSQTSGTGTSYQIMERAADRDIIARKITVGGGCAGEIEGGSGASDSTNTFRNSEARLDDNGNVIKDESSTGGSQNKDVLQCVNCPSCSTFHDEVRKKNGKFHCRNKNCSLAEKS